MRINPPLGREYWPRKIISFQAVRWDLVYALDDEGVLWSLFREGDKSQATWQKFSLPTRESQS